MIDLNNISNVQPTYAVADWVVIFLIVLVVSLIIAAIAFFLLAGKAEQNGPDDRELEDFRIPTSSEDRPITVIFGTVRVAPNLVWYGGVTEEEIKVKIGGGGKSGGSQKQIVGYARFATLLYAIGTVCDSILEFYRANDLMWSGTKTNGQSFSAQTGEVSDQQGSGNGPSSIVFYDGDQTSMGSYPGRSGDDTLYLGTSLLWMNSIFVGDNAVSLPNYSVVVKKVELYNDWDYSDISGDANPAEVLYYILDKLLEINTDRLDLTSFQSVANTLYTEGTGISFTMSRPKRARDYVEDILRHIDGHIFFNETTGKFELQLVRDDYVVGSLPTVTDSMTKNLKLKRGTWDTVATDLVVRWTKPKTFDTTSARVINPATRLLINESRIQSVELNMFTNTQTVQKAVRRLRKRQFYPLAAVTFECDRSAFDPDVGDPFKLNSNVLGFSGMVCRVTGVEADSRRETRIQVEGVEDIWGVGNADLLTIQEGLHQDTNYIIANQVPYWFVYDSIAELALNKSIVVLAAGHVDDIVSGFYVFINDQYIGQFECHPTATIDAAYPNTTGIVDEETGFTLENCINVEAVSNSEGSWQRLGTVALIDQGSGTFELVSIKTITDNLDGTFDCTGIIRDIAGTGVKTHPLGSRVWLITSGLTSFVNIVDISDFATSAALSVKIRPFNRRATGPDRTVSHTYQFIPETPYDPTELTGDHVSTTVDLEWMPRTRNDGAHNVDMDSILVYDAPSEGTWEITADDGYGPVYESTPSHQRTGIGTSQTYTVKSVLNGRKSAGVQITL